MSTRCPAHVKRTAVTAVSTAGTAGLPAPRRPALPPPPGPRNPPAPAVRGRNRFVEKVGPDRIRDDGGKREPDVEAGGPPVPDRLVLRRPIEDGIAVLDRLPDVPRRREDGGCRNDHQQRSPGARRCKAQHDGGEGPQ